MDTRKARSRQAIEDAFLGLLLERDYTKITVADILERSGVGRATFYAQQGREHAEVELSLCSYLLPGNVNLHSQALQQHESLTQFTHQNCNLPRKDALQDLYIR